MKKEGISFRKMAKDLKICHTSLFKYCSGTRRPRLPVAVKIEKYTDGQVTCKELI